MGSGEPSFPGIAVFGKNHTQQAWAGRSNWMEFAILAVAVCGVAVAVMQLIVMMRK